MTETEMSELSCEINPFLMANKHLTHDSESSIEMQASRFQGTNRQDG